MRPSALILMRVLRVLGIAWFAYIAMLYFMQRDFIYYPMRDQADTDAQDYTLTTSPGISLRGWVVNPGQERGILYFGGNAERLSHTIPIARQHFPDYSVYLVHYRGYGDSDGEPTEDALLNDALALHDDLRLRHPRISIIGRSLGSAVATFVASQREVEAVVLITPFDSILRLAEERYPAVPVKLLLKDKFESWKFARHIDAPTLMLVAEQDSIVPRRHSDNLLRHFKPGVAKVIELPGTSHVSISHHPGYYPLITDFLDMNQKNPLLVTRYQ